MAGLFDFAPTASKEFRDTAPNAVSVFYRSYSRRKEDGTRENYDEVIHRTIGDISRIGDFTEAQQALVLEMGLSQHCFPSGRALWVAGTEWSKKPENFPGYYNCCSMQVEHVGIFGLLMELAMMGTGTGAVLEDAVVAKLPPITRELFLLHVTENKRKKGGREFTQVNVLEPGDNPEGIAIVEIVVGDSRQGWASAYQSLIELAMGKEVDGCSPDLPIWVNLDLTQVRQSGERLKGFGGVANPVRLRTTLERVIKVLAGAKGRQLKPIECCMLIDEAASAVVAGNVRRSAGMKQFSSDDAEAASSKDGLYKQGEDGSWSVDPEKEALRMSNHTRCFHYKPTYKEVEEAVTKQFWSGEGAIQYVPEMIARSNADLLNTPKLKKQFLDCYLAKGVEGGKDFLREQAIAKLEPVDDKIIDHRITRYGLNPCGEISIRDNLCNLSEVHVNTIDPADKEKQRNAFYAAGLQVAALLNHDFIPPELSYSRRHDPIVGVSLTGGFDFFVHALGFEWLEWMMKGRPAGRKFKLYTEVERDYLTMWRKAAEAGVIDYCDQHGLLRPNRCTTVQPAGTKSLLTGASPGWHPPKAQRFIRRITFGKNDPLAAALRDYGYKVIPAQSARDERGNLLDDVNDPRVHEVLVEIPTEVSWANFPGCDQFDLAKLPIKAQWGLYMQFQNYYTTHNTSATLEFRQEEIPVLSQLIYDNIQQDGGYISAALLARFDSNETFPRLPFEPISKDTYDRLMAQVLAYRSTLSPDTTILDLLKPYDNPDHVLQPQDAACTSSACLAKIERDEAQGLT
jgi:ribonucleotide reductase class II